MSQAAQRKEKQQQAIEKPKLDNARKLGCMCVVGPKDVEFKETMKTFAKRWRRQWNQPCLVRFNTFGVRNLVATTNPIFADQDMVRDLV